MKPSGVTLLLATLLALPAQAQWREFLSQDEIQQIRRAQLPNKRLKLYAEFAGQRLATVEKELAGNDARRARRIHARLSEYDQIMDAIAANVEQAVSRRDPVRKGVEGVLEAAPEFLKLLESFRARNPKDLSEYRFTLNQTIDTTQDSIQSLQQVLEKLPKGKKEKKSDKRKAKRNNHCPPKVEFSFQAATRFDSRVVCLRQGKAPVACFRSAAARPPAPASSAGRQ